MAILDIDKWDCRFYITADIITQMIWLLGLNTLLKLWLWHMHNRQKFTPKDNPGNDLQHGVDAEIYQYIDRALQGE
ncbi:hypothetical protein [Sporosarcina limicola]|uniref:Uncharacterized protein n=1 Tax=Sporosarcina limicola TaxID=34101 RepID=A0A927R4T4_9BACL|nr:hypothetical protein [Sporosarcina limicola]MBE1553214.1 hypothetical protein [Sporosarcina limicola]